MRPRPLMVGLLLGLAFLSPAASSGIRAGQSFSELRTVTLDGKHVRVLFKSLINDEYSRWWVVDLSRDRKLALMSEVAGDPLSNTKNLYLTDIHGHPRRLLMTATGFEPVGSWAPDARRFAYMDQKNEASSCADWTFRSGSPGSGEPTTLGEGELFAWGPKGSFAIQQKCGLVFTDPAGVEHQITTGWGFGLAISPRGDRIAYVDSGEFGGYVLHIASTRTGREVGTIENANSVAWAPGGRRFAFVKNPDNSGAGFGAIAIADANGKHVRTVIRASWPPPYYGVPTWSPDGRFVAFQRGFLTIGIVKPTGAGRRYIVHQWPVVGLRGWSPDSRRIYYDGVFR